MAGQPALRVTRNQLVAICGRDVDLVRQFERLYVANGGETLAEDATLSTTATTITHGVLAGTYAVDLTALLDITGGGGADGVNLAFTQDPSGTVLATNLALVATTAATSAGGAVSSSATFGPVTSSCVVRVNGFLRVTRAGTVGFSFVTTGAPGACLLLTGSGIILTRIS